jgi:hypothetical protein
VVVYFETAALDDTVNRLQARGIVFTQPHGGCEVEPGVGRDVGVAIAIGAITCPVSRFH